MSYTIITLQYTFMSSVFTSLFQKPTTHHSNKYPGTGCFTPQSEATPASTGKLLISSSMLLMHESISSTSAQHSASSSSRDSLIASSPPASRSPPRPSPSQSYHADASSPLNLPLQYYRCKINNKFFYCDS